jgi:hypothetical protein
VADVFYVLPDNIAEDGFAHDDHVPLEGVVQFVAAVEEHEKTVTVLQITLTQRFFVKRLSRPALWQGDFTYEVF